MHDDLNLNIPNLPDNINDATPKQVLQTTYAAGHLYMQDLARASRTFRHLNRMLSITIIGATLFGLCAILNWPINIASHEIRKANKAQATAELALERSLTILSEHSLYEDNITWILADPQEFPTNGQESNQEEGNEEDNNQKTP